MSEPRGACVGDIGHRAALFLHWVLGSRGIYTLHTLYTSSLSAQYFNFVFVLVFFLAVPHGMWDLISLTRYLTHSPYPLRWESGVLTTGL